MNGGYFKVKPMSVNKAYRGRRFKTEDYKTYEIEIASLLPRRGTIEITHHLHIEFGYSTHTFDIDNVLKPFIDVLQRYYGFNDNIIEELSVKKKRVKLLNEYIRFWFE